MINTNNTNEQIHLLILLSSLSEVTKYILQSSFDKSQTFVYEIVKKME